MRAALHFLSRVLILAGVMLVLDAALTVLWQEPITAIYGAVHQSRLGSDLDRLDRTPPTAAEAQVLKTMQADPERIAFLARALRRRARDGHAIGRIRIPHIHANYV